MSNRTPARELDRIMIRLPDGMREQIAERATANRRSMTQEVVAMLMQVLGNPDELELVDLEARLKQAEAAAFQAAAAHEEADRIKFALIDEIEARRRRLSE